MKSNLNRIGRATLGLLAGGMVLSSSCSSSEIGAVIAGANAVVDVVVSPSAGSAVDVARWLADELND